jgi:hypothetical protein
VLMPNKMTFISVQQWKASTPKQEAWRRPTGVGIHYYSEEKDGALHKMRIQSCSVSTSGGEHHHAPQSPWVYGHCRQEYCPEHANFSWQHSCCRGYFWTQSGVIEGQDSQLTECASDGMNRWSTDANRREVLICHSCNGHHVCEHPIFTHHLTWLAFWYCWEFI